ncbi:MAG: DUF445 domain-containing protein [Edaphocola sp.]
MANQVGAKLYINEPNVHMLTELHKKQQLRNHKALATGLFMAMAALYALCTWLEHKHYQPWVGYVRAFAEAAMVGALADWFAVTALFRYPLGLRIPHTNLIERSKQSIGDNLGNFVVENFLSPKNIRPYVQQLKISTFVAQWLAKEKNRQMVAQEGLKLANDIVQKIDNRLAVNFLGKKAAQLLQTLPLHEFTASALTYMVKQKEQDKLVTLLAARIKAYITANEQMVQDKVKEESYFFVPKFVNNKLADKISSGLVKYFDEIEHDPNHKIRAELTQQLNNLATEMRTGEKWRENFASIKTNLLREANLERYMADLWQSLRETLMAELNDGDTALGRYINKSLQDLGTSLNTDEALQRRIDKWVRLTAYKYVLRNTDNVALLISRTVGNWQGKELSEKLELEVGKDLQFIRINGTVVGGLVGLLIYVVTQVLTEW